MDQRISEVVRRLHASPGMAVVAVTGGGAQALSWLLGVPGASRTILEARVPYATSALADFLGYEPKDFATADTARDMARAAFERALALAPSGASVAGVACAAALATDRPRSGEHRCFTAGWSERSVNTYGVTLVKDLRDRAGEDVIASKLVLRALAEASGIEFNVPMGLKGREHVAVFKQERPDLIERLLAGEVRSVTANPDGRRVADGTVSGGVLPGAFEPLHQGHEELARIAASILGRDVTFELSVANVDKPLLPLEEVRRRVAQFAGKMPVVVTRAATFEEKSRLFPGCTFVIGWDTAVRLVDRRYYSNDEASMLTVLASIRGQGCRFLVAGRLEDGVYRTLGEVAVPAGFEDMLSEIPREQFRIDISSTELRAARKSSSPLSPGVRS